MSYSSIKMYLPTQTSSRFQAMHLLAMLTASLVGGWGDGLLKLFISKIMDLRQNKELENCPLSDSFLFSMQWYILLSNQTSRPDLEQQQCTFDTETGD